MRKMVTMAAVLSGMLFGLAGAAAEITTDTLLDQMVDLKRLTRLPNPAYTTKQFSSYDQNSKSFSNHHGWFANGDRGWYLRTEEMNGRKEYVMMDAEGPGAMVRIWSANPEGTLRIYLDGSSTPVIEEDMKALLTGEVDAFPEPLSGMRARGTNLYFPIPYAKSCKITSDKGDFYYHVNYRTYEKGTKVKTFTPGDLKTYADKIAEICERLSNTRAGGGPPAERTKKPFDESLAPDGRATLWTMDGSKAICGFLVHLDAEDLVAAARGLVLSMTFDGETTVHAPVGDFFGMAPGVVPYASLPLGVTNDSPADMWCHWWMPFEKDAKIEVHNLSDTEVRIHGAVAVMPYDWASDSLHFHAKWRIDPALPSRPMNDWMHLSVRGRGRFVGGALHLINPVKGWWGEGDEKIYVDDETFPSHFGTGTEDYYGYAWCDTGIFSHAYHGQPYVDGPANYGNVTNNRYHIIDDIPFENSFRFDIENWHWAPNVITVRDAISYWYCRPKSHDFFGPITKEMVADPPYPLEYKTWRLPGALEGEDMQVLEKTGLVGKQLLGESLSGEQQFWWREGKPGDKVKLGFDVDANTRRTIMLRPIKSFDYAIVQFYINGKKAGDPVDLYSEKTTIGDEVNLGSHALHKGQNTLTLELVGINPKADKKFMAGVDYILLK